MILRANEATYLCFVFLCTTVSMLIAFLMFPPRIKTIGSAGIG